MAQGFLQQLAIAERELAAEEINKKSGEGHHAQAAKLNRHENHDLPKERERRAGIDHGQTGHADGGGDGEERVDETYRLVMRDREHEQERGDSDSAGKTENKNARRTESALELLREGDRRA